MSLCTGGSVGVSQLWCLCMLQTCLLALVPADRHVYIRLRAVSCLGDSLQMWTDDTGGGWTVRVFQVRL